MKKEENLRLIENAHEHRSINDFIQDKMIRCLKIITTHRVSFPVYFHSHSQFSQFDNSYSVKRSFNQMLFLSNFSLLDIVGDSTGTFSQGMEVQSDLQHSVQHFSLSSHIILERLN